MKFIKLVAIAMLGCSYSAKSEEFKLEKYCGSIYIKDNPENKDHIELAVTDTKTKLILKAVSPYKNVYTEEPKNGCVIGFKGLNNTFEVLDIKFKKI